MKTLIFCFLTFLALSAGQNIKKRDAEQDLLESVLAGMKKEREDLAAKKHEVHEGEKEMVKKEKEVKENVAEHVKKLKSEWLRKGGKSLTVNGSAVQAKEKEEPQLPQVTTKEVKKEKEKEKLPQITNEVEKAKQDLVAETKKQKEDLAEQTEKGKKDLAKETKKQKKQLAKEAKSTSKTEKAKKEQKEKKDKTKKGEKDKTKKGEKDKTKKGEKDKTKKGEEDTTKKKRETPDLSWAKKDGNKDTKWGPPREGDKIPFTGIKGKQLVALSGVGRQQRKGWKGVRVKRKEWVPYAPKKQWFKLKISRKELCPRGYYLLGRKGKWRSKAVIANPSLSTHTMCDRSLRPDRKHKFMERGLTMDDIRHILREHNKLRANPGQMIPDGKKRFGGAMMKLYWDPNIAQIAQRLADTCRSTKKGLNDVNRDVLGYGDTGDKNTEKDISPRQNICIGPKGSGLTWSWCISTWFNESKNLKWGSGKIDKKKPIELYVNMMTDVVTRIGCGHAMCANGAGRRLVCNYALNLGLNNNPPNAWKTSPFRPAAKPCEFCPDKCKNGLCDCKGKICYNRGRLNPKTCECTCENSYYGDTCQNLDSCWNVEGKCKLSTKSQCVTSVKHRQNCPVLCRMCLKKARKYEMTPSTTLIGEDGKTTTYPAGKDNT